MSIATEARVESLEKRIAQLEDAHLRMQEHLSKAYDIIAEYRQLFAARKPGPKPKEQS